MHKTARKSDADSRLLRPLLPIAVTVLVLLILLAGTIPLLVWLRIDSQVNALAEHRAKWRGYAPADYAYTVTKVCDCGRLANVPVRVTVRDYRLVSMLAGERGFAHDDLVDVPADMIAVFDLVASAIASRPDTLTASYDARYGFPTMLRVDPNRVFDGDEIVWKVTSVEFF